MANTTNIDLVKPAGTDHALVSVINSNSDKIDAEAGRQRGNFAGTYSSTSGYAVGDYCIYQGNLYRCTTAIGSSGENWTAGHWTSVKVGTELKGLSDQITNKLNCVEKTTGSGKTFTITFDGYGAGYNAYIFGRFGFDSTKLSSAIVSHGASGSASIKCFGDETATVSCSGDVVTVTTQNNYAAVTVISSKAIT